MTTTTRTAHTPVVLDDPDHLATALDLFATAMVGLPHGLFDLEGVQDGGRVLGVFDDGELVATANSYASGITVPGGQTLPHAAVTHIGVRASHRRRGIAARLVTRQLELAREAGEVIATLRASQPGIYERFGYGVASLDAEVVIDARAARLRGAPAGPVREVPVGGSSALQQRIYADRPHAPAGTVGRPDAWWRTMRADDPGRQHYLAVHGSPGREDGYVRYHPIGTDDWFHSAERTVVVDDLVADSLDAYVALIDHLLRLDLVDRIVLHSAPVDHPVGDLLTDVRAVSVAAVRDETWLRLLDVETALGARTYGAHGPLVIEVTDPLIADNAGRFVVGAGPVVRTDAPADLVADVDALAAVYLGRPAWAALAQTGRIEVRTPGALETAERLFATRRAPYAGTLF